MNRWLLVLALLVASTSACRRGPHVTPLNVNVTMYQCATSDTWHQAERTIAICASYQECNDICANLSTTP